MEPEPIFSGIRLLIIVVALALLILIIILIVEAIKKIIILSPDRRKKVLRWILSGLAIIILGLVVTDLITYHINTTNAPNAVKKTEGVINSLKSHNIDSESWEPSEAELANLKGCSRSLAKLNINVGVNNDCARGYIVIATIQGVEITKVVNDLATLGMTIAKVNGKNYGSYDNSTIGESPDTIEYYKYNSETLTPEIFGYFPENKNAPEWEQQIRQSKLVTKITEGKKGYIAGNGGDKISLFRKTTFTMISFKINRNSSDDEIRPLLESLEKQGVELHVATGIEPAYIISVPQGQELYWAKNIKQKIPYISNSKIIFVKGVDLSNVVPL